MLSHREYNIAPCAAQTVASLSPSQLATKYGTTGRRIVLYAGTFEPYQGLDLLVDAAPTVVLAKPDVLFLCLGGSEAQITALREQMRTKGVERFFVLPGVVPAEEVEAHFVSADILVSLRISGTNTPLKIYSYLRSGVPIIATNIRSHTQVLTPEIALLVEPQPSAVASAIIRLLTDKELGQRLSYNAGQLARGAFSAEAYYAKVAEVYAFLGSRKVSRSR
jgi:glycosyltransferase involved in cell wall biosynthesis